MKFMHIPMNIPNILTLLRIAAIPVIVLTYYLPFPGNHATTAVIFAIAAITDWLDGYLARNWQQTSPFGEFLDPVADKLIVAVALVLIVADTPLPLLSIPAAVIIGREIVISALREWMAEIGKRASVAVSFIGKFKTSLQMLALFILLGVNPKHMTWMAYVGYLFLYVSAALTLWSMVMYLKTAWPNLLLTEQHK
jgi:CDP-diacylglycerol--glycerol-3-phosphate 3-phosphatidyltransferase